MLNIHYKSKYEPRRSRCQGLLRVTPDFFICQAPGDSVGRQLQPARAVLDFTVSGLCVDMLTSRLARSGVFRVSDRSERDVIL